MAKRSRSDSSDSCAANKRTKSTVAKVPHFHGLTSENLVPHSILADGACFFRAIAHQLHGSDKEHGCVRQKAVDWMCKHRSDFECFMAPEARPSRAPRNVSCNKAATATGAYDRYLEKMRLPHEWATNLEVQATAAALDLKICVHRTDSKEVTKVTVDGRVTRSKEVHICFDPMAQHYWSTATTSGKPKTPGEGVCAVVVIPEVIHKRVDSLTETSDPEEASEAGLEAAPKAPKKHKAFEFDSESD